MVARSDLKAKEFMVETDPTKVADKWAESIDNLEYNFKYFKIEDAEAKKAALMVYGGESLRKSHNNLPDPSSGDVFVKAKTKKTKYFSPKKNIDYLIYQFSEIVQGDNEPFITFVNRLREVEKHCEFPDMDKEVLKSREPLRMTELSEEPWQKLSVDFCGPFPCGTYCLLFVDYYSRYPVVEFVTSTSEPAMIPKFEKLFAQFGIPEETKSDNGSPFQSEKFRRYAKRTGFHHRKVTPRHPEANGQAERFVRTVEKAIETYVANIIGRKN